MRHFGAGFSDELEKLAIRLPTLGEMGSSVGTSEPVASPSAEASAPAPSSGQQVHVHVHAQGAKAKAKAPAAAPAKASVPAPAADVPDVGMPSKPDGFGIKAPQKTFVGRHGESFPSEMRREPQYNDVGTGPKKDSYVSGKGLASFLGGAGHPLSMPATDPPPLGGPSKVTNLPETLTSSNVESDYDGLQKAKGTPPAATKGPIIQPMASTKTPKAKKMFGTGMSDEPAKL